MYKYNYLTVFLASREEVQLKREHHSVSMGEIRVPHTIKSDKKKLSQINYDENITRIPVHGASGAIEVLGYYIMLPLRL